MSRWQIIKNMWTSSSDLREVTYIGLYILFHIVVGQAFGWWFVDETNYPNYPVFTQIMAGLGWGIVTFIVVSLTLMGTAYLAFEVIGPAYEKSRVDLEKKEEKKREAALKEQAEEARRAPLNQIYKEAHEAFSERDLKNPEVKRPGPTHLIID